MNDIYPIQEWVETTGDAIAEGIANALLQEIARGTDSALLDTQHHGLPTDHWQDIIVPALEWKIREKLSATLACAAEGWCESYYRALQRKYEGE